MSVLVGLVSANWVAGQIEEFVGSHTGPLDGKVETPLWGKPLVGFSSAADPLYRFFKEDIGDFYLTPAEILDPHLDRSLETGARDLTVVSWILPHTEASKSEMRKERYFPTSRWVMAKLLGEDANDALRRHLVAALNQRGVTAAAPLHSPKYGRTTSERYGRIRTWSERHAAYVSGLGTFGLSDGLITAAGQAIRAGSVIVRTRLPPTPRPYADHHEYCLYFRKRACRKCIQRCPIGAITEKGHNKELCRSYIDVIRQYVEKHYGLKGYACGFCQVGVPCESKIPIHEEG